MTPPAPADADAVYHDGELAIQTVTGDRALARRRAAMIASRIPAGAAAFIATQHLVAVGAADDAGNVWASLWVGAPGIARASEDGTVLAVALDAPRSPDDPVRPLVRVGEPLGTLFIDLATRQRFRVNGTVRDVGGASGVILRVREAFGNCNKFIQRRTRHERSATSAAGAMRGTTLDADRRAFVSRVDTAFVASVHGERGADVSHRGGEPGFVQVVDDRTLRVPDYPGNGMYQTLGNLLVDPRAGFALVDFDVGRVLSLTGRVTLEHDAEHPDAPSGGTHRYWRFAIERWIELSLPDTAAWSLVERSPLNPRA